MLGKKFTVLLGLLVLLGLGQTPFVVGPASAGHSCNRPPWHCHCGPGEFDWKKSVVYSYDGEEIQVKLDKDMKEHVDNLVKNLRDKNLTRMPGFIIVDKTGGKNLLEGFIPAEALRGHVSHFEEMFQPKK